MARRQAGIVFGAKDTFFVPYDVSKCPTVTMH